MFDEWRARNKQYTQAGTKDEIAAKVGIPAVL